MRFVDLNYQSKNDQTEFRFTYPTITTLTFTIIYTKLRHVYLVLLYYVSIFLCYIATSEKVLIEHRKIFQITLLLFVTWFFRIQGWAWKWLYNLHWSIIGNRLSGIWYWTLIYYFARNNTFHSFITSFLFPDNCIYHQFSLLKVFFLDMIIHFIF